MITFFFLALNTAILLIVGFYMYRNWLTYKVRVIAIDMDDNMCEYTKLPNYDIMLYNIRLARFLTVKSLHAASINFKPTRNTFW